MIYRKIKYIISDEAEYHKEKWSVGVPVVKDCSTDTVAQAVREYEGVIRKKVIGDVIRSLRIESPDVVASFGEDAAVIRHNTDDALLLAADGIWSKLMEADPFWAGYCAVLVNVHDIAAMGGRPVAIVDILSVTNDRIRDGYPGYGHGIGAVRRSDRGWASAPRYTIQRCGRGDPRNSQDRSDIIFSNTAEEGVPGDRGDRPRWPDTPFMLLQLGFGHDEVRRSGPRQIRLMEEYQESSIW